MCFVIQFYICIYLTNVKRTLFCTGTDQIYVSLYENMSSEDRSVIVFFAVIH